MSDLWGALGGDPVPSQEAPPQPDPNDFTGQYNTELLPHQEQRFQAWLRQSGRQNDLYDYDLRGAWLSGYTDTRGHMPDFFKKPNHPTFSDGSRYSSDETPGGQWQQMPDQSWSFTPSQHNLKMNDPADLKRYWQRVEPKNKLNLPDASDERQPL